MADAKKQPLKDYSEGLDPAVIRQHFRDDAELERQAKQIASQRQDRRKKMKGDGLSLEAVDLTKKLMKMDPTEAIIVLNRSYFMLKALNAPVGGQLDFHDMVTDNAQMSEAERCARWKGDGANAYIMGKREIDCPHDPRLPAGQSWMQGFREAESEAIQAKTDAEQKEPNPIDSIGSGEKKRRGRPPGSTNKPRVVVDNTAKRDAEPDAETEKSGDEQPAPPVDAESVVPPPPPPADPVPPPPPPPEL